MKAYLIKFLTEHLRFIATRNLDALFLYYYNQFFFEILSTKMCTLKNTAYKESSIFLLFFRYILQFLDSLQLNFSLFYLSHFFFDTFFFFKTYEY